MNRTAKVQNLPQTGQISFSSQKNISKFVCVCAFGNSYQHIYYTMYGNKHQLCYFFHRLSLISLVAAFVTILSGCVNDDDPDFAVLMNDGTTVSTESLRGRRTMIVFFETSCSDCRQELPVIEEVYRQTAGREDVSVICISRAQDQASVADYWEAHGLTLPAISPSPLPTATIRCLTLRPCSGSCYSTAAIFRIADRRFMKEASDLAICIL